MNSLENSTHIPVIGLKFFGLWDVKLSNRKSLNFLYFLYKILNIFSFTFIFYRAVNLLLNFNFQKGGLEIYFSHMVRLVTYFIMILVICEGIIVRDEWKRMLKEFGEIETILAEINLESPRLSTFKKVLIILPALLYTGNVFFYRIIDLDVIMRTNVLFIANYLTMIWFIIYCWNIKNQYKNLELYLHEIQKLMVIKKTKICSRQILQCLQILNQLSEANSRANRFFVLKISTSIDRWNELNHKLCPKSIFCRI